MTTLNDQIKTAFDGYTKAGKTPQQVYDAMKPKLTGNVIGNSVLDNYYNSLTKKPTTGIVTPTPTTPTTPYNQIKTAFDSYTKVGKTPQQVYDAMKPKFAGNVIGNSVLDRYYKSLTKAPAAGTSAALVSPTVDTSTTTPAKRTPIMASTDASVTNNIGNTINTSGLDADTAAAVHKHVGAINQKYDDQINNHISYATGISNAYNQYADEFDPKYAEIRKSIDEQEKETMANYEKIKKAQIDSHASSMDTYARQAAAAQANVTSNLSATGMSAGALGNAMAEAQYNPKRLAAIQALKDKQITDLTTLQQNYINWSNSILQNKTNITSSEKALAQEILNRKDKLDTQLSELKQENITDVSKPLIDTLSTKTTTLGQAEGVDTQKNKYLNDYAQATPDRKKSILQYQLEKDPNLAYVDETMLMQAIGKSMPDAVAFLKNEAQRRAADAQAAIVDKANALTTNRIKNTYSNTPRSENSPGSENPSGSKPPAKEGANKSAEEWQRMINMPANALASVDAMKALMRSKGASEDMINAMDFSKFTHTAAHTRKNISTFKSEFLKGAKSGFVGFTADRAKRLLTKLGNKVIPDSLKPGVAKLYAKSLGTKIGAMIPEVEAQLVKLGEEALAGLANAADMPANAEKILKDKAAKAASKFINPTGKALLSKIAQLGTKALPLVLKYGTMGAKIIGGIPFGVIAGVANPQDLAKDFADYNKDIKFMKKQGVPTSEIKTWLRSEASTNGITDDDLIKYINQQ